MAIERGRGDYLRRDRGRKTRVLDAGPGVRPGDVVVKDEGPYKILKRGDEFVVIKADDGEVLGRHDTLEDAEAQVRAIGMRTHGR